MSENRPRRVVAEIRFSEGRSPVAKVTGRSIHQYWTLLAAHFRDVLLAPQRRSDDGGVSWTWKEAGDVRPVSAADLDRVRKRLQAALESFVDSPGNPGAGAAGHGGLEAQTTVEQLTVRVTGLVERFIGMADPALSQFVCRTESGPMIHSWGLDTPAPLTYPDASESEINGTVLAGRNTSAGHDVVLENANGLRMARVTSDADGEFRFRHLRPGRYRVRVLSDRVKFPPKGEAVTLERGASVRLELRSEEGAQSEQSETSTQPGSSTPFPTGDAEPPRTRSRRSAVIGALALIVVLAAGYGGYRLLTRPSGRARDIVRESYMTPERFDSRDGVTAASRASSQPVSPSMALRAGKAAPSPVHVETAVVSEGSQHEKALSSTASRGPASSPKPFATADASALGGDVATQARGDDMVDRASGPSNGSRGGGAAKGDRRSPSRRSSTAAASRDGSTPVPAQGAPQPGGDAVDVGSPSAGATDDQLQPAAPPGAGRSSTQREVVNTTRVQTGAAAPEPPLSPVENAGAGDVSSEELPVSSPAGGTRKQGSVLVRASGKEKAPAAATPESRSANDGSLPEMSRGAPDESALQTGGEATVGPRATLPASAVSAPHAAAPNVPAGTSLFPDIGVDESIPPDDRLPPQKGVGRPTKIPAPPPSAEPAPVPVPGGNETQTRLVQEQSAPAAAKSDAPVPQRPGGPSGRQQTDAAAGAVTVPAEAPPATSATDADPAEPSAQLGAPPRSARPAIAGASPSSQGAGVPPSAGAASLRVNGRAADSAVLEPWGSFWLSGWNVKLAKDMIVPTRPVRAGERDPAAEDRRRLLDEEKRRLPATFRAPVVHCELVLVVPPTLAAEPLAWDFSNMPEGAVLMATFERGVAVVGWRVGARLDGMRAELVRPDGSRLAEVVFSPSGRCSFAAAQGIAAHAEIAVVIAIVERRTADSRFAWQGGDAGVPNPERAVLRVPLALGSRGEVPLVLRDRESGWVLSSTLILDPGGR